jgi:Trk K+ transport system NAD-binding subunit
MGLDVLGTFSVGQQSFMVGAVVVAPGSELVGMPISGLSHQTRVIAVAREGSEMELYPRRNSEIGAGDTVYIVGPYHELLTMLRKGQVGHPRRARPPMNVTEGLGISAIPGDAENP